MPRIHDPIAEDVATREDVREAIVVVPADSSRGPVAAEACKLASHRLRQEAWWFHAVPEVWICARLREHVARFHLFGYPSWIYRGHVLSSMDARDAVLADVGLAISTDETRYFEPATDAHLGPDSPRDLQPSAVTEGAPRRLGTGVFWRGRPMGL